MTNLEDVLEATTITVPMNELLEVLGEALPFTAVQISDETVRLMKLEVLAKLEQIGLSKELTAKVVLDTFGEPPGLAA